MERASSNAKRLPGQPLGLRDTLRRVAEAPWFGVAVTAVIIINAVTLGLETWPAAMRVALPKANPSLYLPMSLALTFPFNIALGIPLYYAVIDKASGKVAGRQTFLRIDTANGVVETGQPDRARRRLRHDPGPDQGVVRDRRHVDRGVAARRDPDGGQQAGRR